jgi:hypothetical protein
MFSSLNFTLRRKGCLLKGDIVGVFRAVLRLEYARLRIKVFTVLHIERCGQEFAAAFFHI